MHGNFIYSQDISDVEQKDEAPRVEKTARRLLMLTAVFISGGMLWIFIISPVTVPARMDISTFSGFNRAQVLYYAGIPENATYIAINAAQAQMRLSRHFMVESARIVKRFPDRIAIYVEPRRAVAVTLSNINGRTLPVYIDRHGVIMRIGNMQGEMPAPWLPVISGLFDETIQPYLGMRVPPFAQLLFSRIGLINDEDQNIWQAVSEIGISTRTNDLFDLILFPVNNSIRLRMGNGITTESMYYALLMADVSRQLSIQGREDVPYEIDVRSGIGVLRSQEARFGE